jgi:hypothetical protein
VLLRPDRPLAIREEEVVPSGVTLERRWQYARWHDGTAHVWLQHRKRPGRGERSSGIRWDVIDRTRVAPAPKLPKGPTAPTARTARTAPRRRPE